MKGSHIKLPLDHVGIAVNDIEASKKRYIEALQAEILHEEVVPSQGVKVCFLSTGSESLIELLQALDQDSPVARFLKKRGEGLHHIAFSTSDINLEFERLKAQGLNLIQEKPIPGANNKLIFFIHPKSMDGTLVEICQPR